MQKKYMIMIVIIALCSVICAAFLNQSIRLRDFILTLLTPELQKASDDFYSDYLSDNPSVTYYVSQIISLKKNDRGYTVKIGIEPYLGPHYPVGYDVAEYSVDNTGSIMLLDFSHKKNYEFPARLGVTIKKPIPIA